MAGNSTEGAASYFLRLVPGVKTANERPQDESDY